MEEASSAAAAVAMPLAPLRRSLLVHVTMGKFAALAAASNRDEERQAALAKARESADEVGEMEKDSKGRRVAPVIWLCDEQGNPLGPMAEWPARKSFTPMWNSARRVSLARWVGIGESPQLAQVRVRIELWKHCEDHSRQLMAQETLAIGQLPSVPTPVQLHRPGVRPGQSPPATLILHVTPSEAACCGGERGEGPSTMAGASVSGRFLSALSSTHSCTGLNSSSVNG